MRIGEGSADRADRADAGTPTDAGPIRAGAGTPRTAPIRAGGESSNGEPAGAPLTEFSGNTASVG
jgi:hypothetical protein